jgi:hypothetical protein
MPSLRTRTMYNAIVLATASDALVDAAAAVSSATADLEAIADGTLDLDAITIGGTRFVNDGGTLVAEP